MEALVMRSRFKRLRLVGSQSSGLRKLNRSLFLEALEVRQLLATDILTVGSNSLTPNVSFDNTSSIASISIADSFKNAPAQNLNSSDTEFLGYVDSLVANSQQNRESGLRLPELIPGLIGDFKNSIENSPKHDFMQTVSLLDAKNIVTEDGSENRIDTKKLSNALNLNFLRGNSPDILTTEINIGGYCAADGSVILPQTTEFGRESVQLGSSLALRMTEEPDNDDSIVPEIHFPSLTGLSIESNINEFTPDATSFSTIDFEGSFTEDSLTNPNMNATGVNWVHKITNNWVDSGNWSFSEQFIAVYDTENSSTVSTEINDWTVFDEDQENPEGPTSSSDIEGDWESDATVSRQGFLIYSFSISRGPVTGGNSWTFSVSFSDTIEAFATSSLGISYGIQDIYLNPPPVDPPEDFTLQDHILSTYSSSVHESGSLSLTMIPALNSSNEIEYSFSGHSSTEYEHDESIQMSFSSGGKSGNLSFPAFPASPQQNPLVNCVPIIGENPFGIVYGQGTAYLSSEESTSSSTTNGSGDLTFSGKIVNGSLSELDATGYSTSENNIEEDHSFHDSAIVKLAGLFTTSLGDVEYDLVLSSFSSGGAITEGISNDEGDSTIEMAPGDPVSVNDNGTLTGSGDSIEYGNGVFNISATYTAPKTWETYHPNDSAYDIGAWITSRSFNLSFQSAGEDVALIDSLIDGDIPPTILDTADVNANSTLTLTAEYSSVYVNESYYNHIGSYSHSREGDLEWTVDSITVVTVTTDVEGTISNEHLPDGSIDWSLNGTKTVNVAVSYEYDKVRDHTIIHTDYSGAIPYSEHVTRVATFEGSKETVTVLDATGNTGTSTNAETAAITSSSTKTYVGDEFVDIDMTWVGDDVIFAPPHEWLDLTAFEVVLQDLLSRNSEELYGRTSPEEIDSFFSTFAEGEGDSASQRRLTAGSMAAEMGLYTGERHRDAYRGALEMQSLFANATPGVGAALGVRDAIAGTDSITENPLSWSQRGLGLLGALPFLGALSNAADAAGSASRASKAIDAIENVADLPSHGPVHHIATNKFNVSTLRGGPWTPKFKKIFDKAGIDLDDDINKVRVPNHKGPHPKDYHEIILDRLETAVDGLSGEEYKAALVAQLNVLKIEVTTVGSVLNLLVTKLD